MLKRLQWRFIRIAMGSTLLVFVFLLAAINILSYGRLLQGADAMLRFISDNDGRLPEYAQVLSGDLRPEPAVHYTEETPFFTRFFVVHGDGTTVTDVEMERIAAVSEAEAADFYVQAVQQEREYGFCGDYRYRAVEDSEDTTVVFLNFEPDRRTAINTLLISATVAAVAYLAVFLLVYLLSKRAIRPMLRSAEQQKQFLTDAGHELKTPLTIISTSADVLDAELPNNEWVASIRRQARRMSGLIANLITLSRMEEETPFQNDSFVLSEAVWDVAEQYRAVAETRQRHRPVGGAGYCGAPRRHTDGGAPWPFHLFPRPVSAVIILQTAIPLSYTDSDNGNFFVFQEESPMASLSIRNARAIVTVDDADRVLTNGNLLIEDGVITYVGPEEQPADRVLDARGCFVYPGLVNTHHHLYQTFTRNLPQVQKMELFPWLVTLYEIWRGLDEDCIYYSSLTGMGELLRYGCTTCMDHHYVFPKTGSEGFIDRQFQAAAELGVRFHATRGSMSRGKSDGGLPPDDLVQPVDVILEDSRRLVERYHNPEPFSMAQVSLAPCSPFSVTTDLLKESAVLARQLGVRLHTHLCETKDEERFCLEVLGKRPLEYMADCGWLGSDVWYAHGIHFNDDELRLLAETKTGVTHCPVSNMKLASGVCRIPDMLKLGVPVGLAVDGSASNDCSNLLAEIRAAYLLHRLTYSTDAPTGYELLKMATRGSAAVLGRDDIGQLAVGKAGDLFLLDVDSIDQVGALLDPRCFLGTVGYARPCKAVVVGGQVVVEDGRLTGIDEPTVREQAQRCMEQFLERA